MKSELLATLRKTLHQHQSPYPLLEKIVNKKGLQHLAENVFWNLEAEDLKICVTQIDVDYYSIFKSRSRIFIEYSSNIEWPKKQIFCKEINSKLISFLKCQIKKCISIVFPRNFHKVIGTFKTFLEKLKKNNFFFRKSAEIYPKMDNFTMKKYLTNTVEY